MSRYLERIVAHVKVPGSGIRPIVRPLFAPPPGDVVEHAEMQPLPSGPASTSTDGWNREPPGRTRESVSPADPGAGRTGIGSAEQAIATSNITPLLPLEGNAGETAESRSATS